MSVLESPSTADPAFLSTPSKIIDEIGFSLLSLTSPAPISTVFATPQLDRNICCADATCSVCLSPLLHRSALVETRCKHIFHEKCLREAKCQKAECPNCRAALTPPQQPQVVASIVVDHSVGQRDAIIARSLAARNAVRLGIARREQDRQQAELEMRNSNKENSRHS